MILEQLKYPIGKFEWPKIITKDILAKWISDIVASKLCPGTAIDNNP